MRDDAIISEIRLWVAQQLEAIPIPYHTIHVNNWTRNVDIHVFVPTRADLKAVTDDGRVGKVSPQLVAGVRQNFSDFVLGRQVQAHFDSYQTVLEEFEGNWYYYYK